MVCRSDNRSGGLCAFACTESETSVLTQAISTTVKMVELFSRGRCSLICSGTTTGHSLLEHWQLLYFLFVFVGFGLLFFLQQQLQSELSPQQHFVLRMDSFMQDFDIGSAVHCQLKVAMRIIVIRIIVIPILYAI